MQWRSVKGYEGLYEISDTGIVKSIRRPGAKGGNLKPDVMYDGYHQVTLYKNNVTTRFKVHRLVAIAFIGESDLCVNHIDGNRSNNNVDNLEWVTHKQNTIHAMDRIGPWQISGEKHATAKLTRLQVDEIIENKRGITGRQLAKEFGVSEAQVSRIKNGTRWNK